MNNVFTFSRKALMGMIFMIAFIAFVPQQGKSCIDPDTVATLTTNYNSDFTEIEIRVGNLKLMTEQPNVFCSCALASFTELFTYLEYVAFVETGTNNVYGNMAPWENTQPASDAWNNAQPNVGNWEGFIAEVINDGLAPQDDVELIIRASTPPGFYAAISDIDTSFYLSYLGTDAWDPTTQDLFADHQGLRNLGSDIPSKTYNEVSDDYFVNLDNSILLNVNEVKNNFPFSIAPNPVKDVFQISYSLEKANTFQFQIFDVAGQLIYSSQEEEQPSGNHLLTIEPPKGLKNGMYLIEIISGNLRGVQKLLIAK